MRGCCRDLTFAPHRRHGTGSHAETLRDRTAPGGPLPPLTAGASRPAAPTQLTLLRGKAVCAARSGPCGRPFRAPAAAALLACRALGPGPPSGLRPALRRDAPPFGFPSGCAARLSRRAAPLACGCPAPRRLAAGPGYPRRAPARAGCARRAARLALAALRAAVPAALRLLWARLASCGGSPSAGPPGQPPPCRAGCGCCWAARPAAPWLRSSVARACWRPALRRPAFSGSGPGSFWGLEIAPGYPRPATPARRAAPQPPSPRAGVMSTREIIVDKIRRRVIW